MLDPPLSTFAVTYPHMVGSLHLDLVTLPGLDAGRAVVKGWKRQRVNAELVFLRVELTSVPVVEFSKLEQ